MQSDASTDDYKDVKNDSIDNRPHSARQPSKYKEQIFTPSPTYYKEDTSPTTTSEVVVDGQEIISIVDRVLLSNFSLNHASSLIHEHLTDYTQTPLKPDPLPETRDAPPDETWIEPTVFRKYQYYHAHMNGAKQTLLSGPSLRSPSSSITSPNSRSQSMRVNGGAAFLNGMDQCEFTVTHQVIVPSQSAQNSPNIRAKDMPSKPNINAFNSKSSFDIGTIGPLESATSMASQISAASSIPMPNSFAPPQNGNAANNGYPQQQRQYVNRSYTFSKSFNGLGVKNPNFINKNDRGSQANKSGVLNWLFTSGKVDNDGPQRQQGKNKNDLNVNINLLRNHFMRAFASLLCGFWKYITPVKYSTTTNVQFDSHGFLGSRQEFNYNKQPLEELLLACDEQQKDEIENIILRLQLQFDIFFVHELFIPPHPKFDQLYMDTFYNINNINLVLTPRAIAKFYLTQVYQTVLGANNLSQNGIDNKVNIFLDEYLPAIIDSATIIADNFEPTDFDQQQNAIFGDDEMKLQQDNYIILQNESKRNMMNNSKAHILEGYEPSVPPPKHELSALILSQFLDRLLSTTIWTHLITHWHYNDNLNYNSIVHPNTKNKKVIPTKIYFNYVDIALKAYKIDRKKLRQLRADIFENGVGKIVRNAIMFKDTSYHHDKKRKSIVVVRKPKEKKHELHCGFEKPWSIRFCRDTAESMEDLQNIFRENAHMIVVNVSWNYRIGAVIGYQQSKLLFESWLASFIRRLEELSFDEDDDVDLHEFQPSDDDDDDEDDKLSDVAEEESKHSTSDEEKYTEQTSNSSSNNNNHKPSTPRNIKQSSHSTSRHQRYASEPPSLKEARAARPLKQSKSSPDNTSKKRSKNNKNNKNNKEGLLSNIGIQIFVRDPRSLKAVVETLKRRRERNDLGGLHPQRIWISAHMLNATQPTAIAKELIISPDKFFQYVDLIPEFTICLSWCTRGGGVFTRQHMEDMKKIVDQYIFKKRRGSSGRDKNLTRKHPKLERINTTALTKGITEEYTKLGRNKSNDFGDIARLKDVKSLNGGRRSSKSGRESSPSLNDEKLSENKKVSKRSFCFYVRASHLFVGDGWKYLHSLLMDRFPTSCVVFTAREEGISITNFKWLSAHFATNKSFYTFENRDIQNDISHLDLLHHVVEATKSPLWYGDLKQHRKIPNIVNVANKINKGNKDNKEIINEFDDEEEKLIYYDGGVLCSEWRTGRFLERSKVYFYNHRFAIVNRGWILSKHELYPPWKMNGRALITGYTQLHILFRTPGAIHKPTSHGNVSYGIRATITTKGEFALETVRLDGQSSKKTKSKIDLKNVSNSMVDGVAAQQPTINAYKNYKHTSSTGFIFPQSTSASAMHTMAFSFELIDYGALYPIEFSIQQLNVHNGYPMSRKQTIRMQVSYPKNDIKCPWYHYVVFNSHQNAMWPILVDRLVINKDNICMPIKNKHLLLQKKTFKKKHFGGGISKRKNIGDML